MRRVVGLSIGLLMVLTSSGLAKVYIYIDSPATTKFPIAIPHFKNMGGVPDTQSLGRSLAQVVSKDLEISGLFRLVDPETFLEDPEKAGITGDQINWRDWSAIGAEALIKGGFYQEDGKLRVEVRLFDVVRGSFITGKRYFGAPEELRLISHKFADEVMYRLTGQKGIFQTQILFVSDESGSKEVYIMDFDGQNKKQLTSHKSIILSPAWSPDGKKILFTSYRDGHPEVYVKDLFSSREKKISFQKGLNIAPEWSPDGGKIVLTLSQDDGNSDIYLISNEGDKIGRLTSDWANDVSPCWSPDGNNIAFVSDRSGSPQVYIMEVKSGNVRRLTFEGSYNTSPAWSPQGNRIAFAGRKEGSFDIYTISVDGRDVRRLTSHAGNNESPSWSPDGRHIVFTSTRSGSSKIYIMLADGSDQRQITWGKGNDTDPCWSPYLTYR